MALSNQGRVIAGALLWSVHATTHAQVAASSAPVINNPAPDPNAPGFRMVPQPITAVGGLNDDPRYELVNVVDATLSETGKLVVIPMPSTEVRIFDRGGRFVRALGRSGQGPGEFTTATQLFARHGDSLLVYDFRQGRFTLFDSLGRVARTRSGAPSATCCFNDESFLTRQSAVSASRVNLRGIRDTLRYSFVDGASTVPSREVLSAPGEEAPVRVENRFVPRPFSRTPWVRIAGEVIVTGTEETYEYRVFSKGGELLRIVRTDAAPTSLTKAQIAATRERWTHHRSPALQREYEKAFDALKHPATLPAYGRIATETDGTVWVKNHDVVGSSEHWWARFSAEGKLLGTLRLPVDREVVRFVRGHVILRYLDPVNQTTKLFVHRIEPVSR